MSTVPAVEIDGNDVTAEIQDRSMSIKFNAVDLTLIDPAVMPAISDVLTVDTPAWSGTVNSIETVAYEGDVPFVKVRAVNTDPLPDNGAGAFNLSDAGTPQGNPAAYKDLSVNTQLQGSTTEVRAKLAIFKEGLAAGDEVDLTSAAHGYTAETFTIMELTTEYPIDNAARYTLDLGLGDYATATTGADGGGPLAPIRFPRVKVPGPSGPHDPWPGGGAGADGSGDAGGVSVLLTKTGSGNFVGTSGAHEVVWPVIEGVQGVADYGTTFPAFMGLSLETGDTEITCTVAGVFTFWYFISENTGQTGSFGINVPVAMPNLSWTLPVTQGEVTGDITFPMAVGDVLYVNHINGAAVSVLSQAYLLITRHGDWDGSGT